MEADAAGAVLAGAAVLVGVDAAGAEVAGAGDAGGADDAGAVVAGVLGEAGADVVGVGVGDADVGEAEDAVEEAGERRLGDADADVDALAG